ncbi:hypothetical protein HAX54_018930 [Datura stramonium]|uniref:Uncharacterized protein n=1 Tax=Datura stramonium TaxID=4076 RepID=A0ABS8UQH1_DATST|nr:hypothetical protein [Datura stramonium]
MEALRDLVCLHEEVVKQSFEQTEILARENQKLEIQRDKALADLEDQEDRLDLKFEFTTLSVQIYTPEQVKAGIDDIDAKILEAQELEKEEGEPLNPFPSILTPSVSVVSPDSSRKIS